MRNFTLSLLLLSCISGFSQGVIFEEFPKKNQLYRRNITTNSAVVPIRGTIDEHSGYEQVRLTLSNEQGVISETEQFLFFTDSSSTFNFNAEIPAERNNHEILISGFKDGEWDIIQSVSNILAGDIFIINGGANHFAGPQCLSLPLHVL